MATCLFVWDKICDYAFLGAFRTMKPFVWGWILFAALRLWLVAHAYLPLQIGVAFEAGSPSACLGQYAHATLSMRKSILPVGKPLFMTAHAMETCFALVTVAANDWAIRCCYGVLASFSELPIFLKPLFFLCKGSVMLRQMESVLCGRFAVTNKIADNLPFSPHRQQKTSIIVDFHGAALMCHIPAFELHVKIKFHFKK